MSSEVIVATNPAKRRTSAKQKAASRRNIKKAQAARRKGGTRRKRRRNTTPARRTATAARPYKRRSNPRRRPTMLGLIDRQIIPALWGGSGAVANDVVLNFLPIPDMLKLGPMRHLVKAGSAIAMGWAGSFFLTKKQSDALAGGALTVVGYNVVRELMARFAPNIAMGEYLDPGMGYYGAGLDPGMGEYLTPGIGQIPGTGIDVGDQFTQGTPYMNGMGTTWPTQVEEESGEYEYD